MLLLQNFQESFKLATFDIGATYQSCCANPRQLAKVFLGAATLSIAGIAYHQVYGSKQTAAQILGLSGYAILWRGYRLPKNHNVQPLVATGSGLISTHAFLLDATGMTIMVGSAAARSLIFSAMPHNVQNDQNRKQAAFGFLAGTTPLYIAAGIYDSPWNLLGFAASACGAFESASTSENGVHDQSHRARALRFGKHAITLIYSAAHAHSLSGVIFETLLSYQTVRSIQEQDLPQLRSGRTFNVHDYLKYLNNRESYINDQQKA